MTLKEALQQFLDEREWKDEIQRDDENDIEYMVTEFYIDKQKYDLEFQIDESVRMMQIVMVSALRIPKNREPQGAVVVNFLNSGMKCGRLSFHRDSGEVLYHWAMDVEGTEPSARQFHNMISAACGGFDPARCQALGAVVFTKLSADEIIENFLAEISKDEVAEAPSEL